MHLEECFHEVAAVYSCVVCVSLKVQEKFPEVFAIFEVCQSMSKKKHGIYLNKHITRIFFTMKLGFPRRQLCHRNLLCYGLQKRFRLKIFLFIISTAVLLYIMHLHQLNSSIRASLIIRPPPVILRNNVTNHSRKLILYWTSFFNWPGFGFGFGHQPFIDRKCSQSNCETTNDRSRIAEADAVVFHIRNLNVADLPKTRFSNQRWVFFLYEQPLLTWLDLRGLEHIFNWTMTYRRDSDIKIMLYETRLRETTLQPEINYASGKSKPIAWLVSNCYHAFSHRNRYVDALQKYIEIDIIGRCGREMPGCYPIGDYNECYKLLEKDYKFYLSFENAICKDYVTEKWSNIANYNLIPIVMGGADYRSIAPPHSYISVHDFQSPRHLADYLLLLDANDTLYNKYFEWKTEYEVYEKSKLFCDLCEKLHDPSLPPKSYDDIHQWWVGKGNCSGVFDLPENEHSLLVKYFDYFIDNLIFLFGKPIYGIMTRFWY